MYPSAPSDRCPVSGQTKSEESLNFWTHMLGLVGSFFGFLYLVYQAHLYGTAMLYIGCVTYGICLVAVYGASTLYHYSRCQKQKAYLKILDHACIYLMIAGTYTPLMLGPLAGTWGWTLLGIVWTAALVGILWKLNGPMQRSITSTIPYLLMGWLGLAIIQPLLQTLPPQAFFWLIAGGVAYTVGVLFYLLESLPFHHAIWHLFVLCGSACHYHLIAHYVINAAVPLQL